MFDVTLNPFFLGKVDFLFHVEFCMKYIDVWVMFHSRSGVDFKLKQITIGGKSMKLTIWDTGNSYV